MAVTVDRLAGIASFFVNGLPIAGTGCVTTAFDTNLPMLLASIERSVGLNGSLDDFRIYGSVLTASEIAAIAAR